MKTLSRHSSDGEESGIGDVRDKSNYVASITSINGCINGGCGCFNLDLCNDDLKYHCRGEKGGTWLSDIYLKVLKVMIIT